MKNYFLSGLALGFAFVMGGFSGLVIALLFWAGFAFIGVLFDGVAAFINGWRASAEARRDSPKAKPVLKIIRGGKAA